MADQTYDDLNETEIEGAGGTQATHSATGPRVHPAVRWVQEHNLETEIREHPIRSMVLAIGAGYLISRIID
ncbi:MAG TPA: hypothetical protein VM100_12470 [Longimicrobiales bacterium]|nr:hypothetical protein [Longimicrobiales bacterium]